MSDSIKSNMLNDRMFETDENCNDDNVHLYSEIADLREQNNDLKKLLNIESRRSEEYAKNCRKLLERL